VTDRELDQRALGVFFAACSLDEEQRPGFLASTCGSDRDLRARVEALLVADAAPGDPVVSVRSAADSVARSLDRTLERAPPCSARYRIEGEIGRGGMGVVYRARDTKLGRPVAIKVLPPDLALDTSRLQRFEREATMLASLNHPNIATVHDLEEADGSLLLVLELIEGETLSKRIRSGTLSMEEALGASVQIATALEVAHARAVIHRDLKPQNVMLDADGHLKVLDFGLAKSTLQGSSKAGLAAQTHDGRPAASALLGTPGYMSPEQTRGEEVDRRADVWAFGCVLFAALSARDAFAGETARERIAATLDREPDWDALPAATPGAVVKLIRRCLKKDPLRRLGDAGDARRELEQALSRLSIGTAARKKRRNNLPRQLTSFVGRVKETAEVVRLLEDDRLVTLTGVGGCGKTRLALKVASEVEREYDDGVWLVELSSLSDAAQVPRALVSVLGLGEKRGRTLTEILVQYLESRTALIVLDNCEHLIAACSQLAQTLLEACPQVNILATSRERFGVVGERTYPVPRMAVPEGEDVLGIEKLGGFESVELFVKRASAARAGFRLNDTNVASVARLCQRLDGIPLGLELAAARVRMLSVDEIAERIDRHVFRLLEGGNETALPRQKTLQATLDWSHDLLSPRAQVLFRRLSVFSDGWTLEAAENVCGDTTIDSHEVLDLMTSLVDKSLVEARVAAPVARYRFLATVHSYAQEKLRVAEEDANFTARHRSHFLSLATTAEPEMEGPDQIEWLDRLERELDNFRTALSAHGKRDQAGDAELRLRLAVSLLHFWESRSYLHEGRKSLERALDSCKATPDDLRARASSALAYLARLQGDLDEALSLQQKSLDLSRKLGDSAGIAGALNGLGLIAQEQSDFGKAKAVHEESLELSRATGDEHTVALVLNNLGLTARNVSDLESAKSLCRESLAISRRLGDLRNIARVLGALSIFALEAGDLEEAQTLGEESLALERQLGHRMAIAGDLNTLGNIANARGRMSVARARYEEAMLVNHEIGNQLWVAYNIGNLGELDALEGDVASAHARHSQCLQVLRRLGDKGGVARTLCALGGLARTAGDTEGARTHLEESLRLARDTGARPEAAEALTGLAFVAAAEVQPGKSARLLAATERERKAGGWALEDAESREWEALVEDLRSALGDDEFAEAWAAGREMSLEECIDHALSHRLP